MAPEIQYACPDVRLLCTVRGTKFCRSEFPASDAMRSLVFLFTTDPLKYTVRAKPGWLRQAGPRSHVDLTLNTRKMPFTLYRIRTSKVPKTKMILCPLICDCVFSLPAHRGRLRRPDALCKPDLTSDHLFVVPGQPSFACPSCQTDADAWSVIRASPDLMADGDIQQLTVQDGYLKRMIGTSMRIASCCGPTCSGGSARLSS
ncbi:hypothetical protein EVAR_22267_1 [Eumeta japonica]|uniref:Uncharacterized protein n=1 Tax=Eumeta variegata TaxID=151549 RepID=A0A4C1UAP9_EUMVA|nr:hypothetical protein EVAR_22267_1 [Eumeta japonica]